MVKYITIDSNVSRIPAIIAKYLTLDARVWCPAVNNCQKSATDHKDAAPIIDGNHKSDIVYYNTPISMADDVRDYTYDPQTTHFIYVDYGVLNPTLSRIMNNLAQLKRKPIVLSNADIFSMGLYNIKVGNCSKETVAEVIAIIIILYQLKSKPPKPDEIRQLTHLTRETEARNQKLDNGQILNIIQQDQNVTRITRPMVIDMYDLIEPRLKNYTTLDTDEFEDCQAVVSKKRIEVSRARKQRPINIAQSLIPMTKLTNDGGHITAAIFHKSMYGYVLISLNRDLQPVNAWSDIKGIIPIKCRYISNAQKFAVILQSINPQVLYLNDAELLLKSGAITEKCELKPYYNMTLLAMLDDLRSDALTLLCPNKIF